MTHKALDVGGGWGGLAPHFCRVSARNLSLCVWKMFLVLGRLLGNLQRVQSEFFILIYNTGSLLNLTDSVEIIITTKK